MSPDGWSLMGVLFVGALVPAVIVLALSRRRLSGELATTRRLFSECMNLAPFCAYIKGVDGRYLYVNNTLDDLMRRDLPLSGSFLGRTDHEIFPAEQARIYVGDDQEVIRQQSPIAFDNSSVATDGTIRRWFTMKFPWIDERGRDCVAGVSVDMSEVERAQETAKVSADRCALALDAGRMGTMTMNLSDGSIETSPLFALLHGRPETKTRLTFDESLVEVHPDDRQPIMEAVQAAIQDAAPDRITYRVVKTDGTVAWIEFVGKVYADDAGRPTIVRGVGFDVTERQLAYEELTRRKAMLRRLIEVQENERQTLCHELHDGMMQYAIGAKMLLEATRDAAELGEQAERIDAAIALLTRGLEEGRRVIRGVRSAVLDDLGLKAAIQDLSDQMAALGITVDMALDDDLDELPPTLHTTIYRVVQESLTNVRKHAETDRAVVEIRRSSVEVRVCIGDHGIGFDVIECRRKGFGLVGMTERVRLVGGTCTITSRPGAGARVEARLPLAAAEERPRETQQHAAREQREPSPGHDDLLSVPAGLPLWRP